MNLAWDWSFLNGCFGHNIRPSDVDGIVERNGHILVIEGKATDGAYGVAQRRLYEALRSRGIEVLVLWGDPEVEPPVISYMQDFPHPRLPATVETVQRFVRDWYQQADRFLPVFSVLR